MIEVSPTRLAAVRMLAKRTSARLGMCGESMLPLLHEPMVLELGASGPDDRVGDILVFERHGQLLAHRITSLRNGVIQTCGDARPGSPEYPDQRQIVGKVVAVFENDAPDARRVDGLLFRARGMLVARLRAVRAPLFAARALAGRFVRSLPWRRQRAYCALVAAISALVRRDPIALERSLCSVDSTALLAIARRHRCSALLAEGVRDLALGAEHALVKQRLQPGGRFAVIRGLTIKAQIVAVTQVLTQIGIPFALLKGAARLYRDEADAVLHPSSDIDVLVKRADLDAAIEAFHKAGYQEHETPEMCDQYRRWHHHAAPLFPPRSGAPIELHTSLAPPHHLSIPLDWDALADHMLYFEEPPGRVACLDGVGAALNLAVHNLRLKSLRDSVLMAQLIQRMTVAQQHELKRIMSAERANPIALQAAVAFAASIAGLAWSVDARVSDYVEWCLRREDVPLYFATRSQFVDAWYAGGGRLRTVKWSLLNPRAGVTGKQIGAASGAYHIVGRAIAGLIACAYASVLRRPV